MRSDIWHSPNIFICQLATRKHTHIIESLQDQLLWLDFIIIALTLVKVLQWGDVDLSWSCTRCPRPLTPLKSPESKSKSTEAIAKVDLDLDEGDLSWSCTRRKASTLKRSRGVLAFLRVQLQRNVDEDWDRNSPVGDSNQGRASLAFP